MILQLSLFFCWEKLYFRVPFLSLYSNKIIGEVAKNEGTIFLITRGEQVTSFQLSIYFKAANFTK